MHSSDRPFGSSVWLLLPLLLLFLFPTRLSALQSKGHISCLCCRLSSLQAGSQTACRMFLREWTWDQPLGSRGQGSRAGQREAEQRCPEPAPWELWNQSSSPESFQMGPLYPRIHPSSICAALGKARSWERQLPIAEAMPEGEDDWLALPGTGATSPHQRGLGWAITMPSTLGA